MVPPLYSLATSAPEYHIIALALNCVSLGHRHRGGHFAGALNSHQNDQLQSQPQSGARNVSYQSEWPPVIAFRWGWGKLVDHFRPLPLQGWKSRKWWPCWTNNAKLLLVLPNQPRRWWPLATMDAGGPGQQNLLWTGAVYRKFGYSGLQIWKLGCLQSGIDAELDWAGCGQTARNWIIDVTITNELLFVCGEIWLNSICCKITMS